MNEVIVAFPFCGGERPIKMLSRAVTVAVTTASPAVVGCHRGCVLPPAVVHVTSHTL